MQSVQIVEGITLFIIHGAMFVSWSMWNVDVMAILRNKVADSLTKPFEQKEVTPAGLM
jgi:hypothetical protein